MPAVKTESGLYFLSTAVQLEGISATISNRFFNLVCLLGVRTKENPGYLRMFFVKSAFTTITFLRMIMKLLEASPFPCASILGCLTMQFP